jgi:hypothetical protein
VVAWVNPRTEASAAVGELPHQPRGRATSAAMPPEAVQAFRFAQGLQTKQDPKSVAMPALLVLENGVFSRATSIRKRNGCEDLGQQIEGTSAEVTNAIRMGKRGTELLEFTSNRCYSRESGAAQWSDAGAVFSAVGADRPLPTTGTDQTMIDAASLAGVTVCAWEDSAGGVWWSVVDAASGRVYRAATQADATGISPRCVAVGVNLHVYWANAAGGTLNVIVVNPQLPAAAATPVQLTPDLAAADPIYDVTPTTRTDSPAILAWAESGSANIRIGYIDQGGTISSPLLGDPPSITFAAARTASTPIGLSHVLVDGANGDRIALAYVTGGGIGSAKVQFLSGGNGNISPIAAVASAIAYAPTAAFLRCGVTVLRDQAAGTITAWTAWEETAAAPTNHYVRVVSVEVTAGSSGILGTLKSVGLVAKPFAIGTDVFVTTVHPTTSFNVYLTFKISGIGSDGNVPVGRHLPGSAAGLPARTHLASAYVAGSIASIALPMRQRLVSENDDKFLETAPRLITIDFDNDQSHQSAEFGKGLYLAGACPMHYDGRSWTELGFHVGPEVITATPAGGGSMTSSTVYEYRAWYEWTDAQGEVHPGPTSPGILVTMGPADTQVTLSLPTCRLTRKLGVRIMVARSLPGSDGNASELFRVTSLDTTTVGAANGYVANVPASDAVSFLDRMNDTTLQTFDELYTDGGILSNDPTPLGPAIARGKNRLFASDPSDPTLVRYSQPIADGIGVQWPPDLFLRVDLQGGSVQGLASIDNRIIIWTERQIWTFAGDGPDQTGGTDTSGFSQAQLVPSGDIGCTDSQSIVFTPRGYLFMSAQGIFELGGDSNINYRGAPVEAFNSQRIRRALQLPDRTQILFLTDSGSTLLYDYLFDQWSTFTNYEGRDCAVVDGRLYYLRTDGRMFAETIGVYSDAGARIRLRLETAWIKMVEYLQGFQKFNQFHLLGTWESAHQLGVQYQTDYTHGWTDAVWLDATGASSGAGWISGSNVVGVEPISGSNYNDGQYNVGEYGGTAPGEYAWRLDLWEVGQSIQFRFEDFEAAGFFGPSFELTELVITGQVLGNVRRPMTAGRSG